MLDIAYIRANKTQVQESSKAKGVDVDVDELLELDEQRREIIAQVETLRAQRNEHTAQLKQGKPTAEQIEKGRQLKDEVASLDDKLNQIVADYDKIMNTIPNVMSGDTPIGPDDSGNQVVRKWGEKPSFDFDPKPHWELGENSGLIDKQRAAKVSGSRFAYLQGGLVELELALTQYIVGLVGSSDSIREIAQEFDLDISTKAFTPVIPPEIINIDVFKKMGRYDPADDKYHIREEEQVLVGSAEHSLGPYFMDEIIDQAELPIRFLGISSAFRREAGTYGKDTKGILRVHQFRKLEMESFTDRESSDDEQKLFVAIQEKIMRDLGLHYQVVAICSGDMGKPDYRQIDIETWMPGQEAYRETNTADNVTDFQSRRLNTRYRKDNDDKEFVFMNDATAASGRALIAILENYQTVEGHIVVPEVLRPFMGGKAVIS